MRTRNGPVSPHGSPCSPSCAAREAFTPAEADGKTAMRPSPVVLMTRPSECSTASRRIASCRSSAAFIAAGNRSHSRVLDSRSANRNVSVWGEGSAVMARESLNLPGQRRPGDSAASPQVWTTKSKVAFFPSGTSRTAMSSSGRKIPARTLEGSPEDLPGSKQQGKLRTCYRSEIPCPADVSMLVSWPRSNGSGVSRSRASRGSGDGRRIPQVASARSRGALRPGQRLQATRTWAGSGAERGAGAPSGQSTPA